MKFSIKDFSSKCELFTEGVFNGKHFIFCVLGKFYLTDTTNKSCGQYMNKGGITSNCIIYAKPQVNWEKVPFNPSLINYLENYNDTDFLKRITPLRSLGKQKVL